MLSKGAGWSPALLMSLIKMAALREVFTPRRQSVFEVNSQKASETLSFGVNFFSLCQEEGSQQSLRLPLPTDQVPVLKGDRRPEAWRSKLKIWDIPSNRKEEALFPVLFSSRRITRVFECLLQSFMSILLGGWCERYQKLLFLSSDSHCLRALGIREQKMPRDGDKR